MQGGLHLRGRPAGDVDGIGGGAEPRHLVLAVGVGRRLGAAAFKRPSAGRIGAHADAAAAERRAVGALQRVQSGPYTLYCGDIFELRADEAGAIAGVFDRGALVALPPDVRPRYAEHVLSLMGSGSQCLLVALEYDQSIMSGPPFSVAGDEVREIYGAAAVEELERTVTDDVPPRFRERGIESFAEVVYAIRR